MRKSMLAGAFAATLALFVQPFIASTAALAQYEQADNQPLVGSGILQTYALQGWGVALSANGAFMATAGYYDDDTKGAVWVFSRSGTTWSQHAKIVPVDIAPNASVRGVALSADGACLVIGAPGGAPTADGQAWIYTRNGANWIRQFTLTPDSNFFPPEKRMGMSVAISADCTKIVVGVPSTDSFGKAYLYTFDPVNIQITATTRLVPSIQVEDGLAGTSVAISSDGTIVMLGGPNTNNSGNGAAWVTRNAGASWKKIVSDNPSAGARFGAAVSMSADGEFAVIGAPGENGEVGAAYVVETSGGSVLKRLAADNPVGLPRQGNSVAIDATGSTIVVGGFADDEGSVYAGATWVYSGFYGTWSQTQKLIGTNGDTGGPITQGWSVALGMSGDILAVGGPNNAAGTGAVWMFHQRPKIDSITPALGDVAGTTPVLIKGTGLSNVFVTFGAFPTASPVAPELAIEVSTTAPAHGAGFVDVVATNGLGLSSTATANFVYGNPVPVISSLSPDSGPTAGSSADFLSISGQYFSGTTSVTFGGVSAAFTFRQDTLLSVTVPPHAAGAVDVVVTNANGSSTAATYTYIAPLTVTAVAPSSGPLGGGTTVIITGTNFQQGFTSDVLFGADSASGFTVDSNTQITATAPAHAAGPVSVTVVNFIGNGVKANAFTYVSPPTVTSISPASGPTSGGTTVIITGTNLAGINDVEFGAQNAQSFTQISNTKVRAVTPAGTGMAAIRVATPGGAHDSSVMFTYIDAPVITAINPNQGPAGTKIAIVGSGLTGVTGVKFGATASTSFSASSDGAATATAPPHAVGAVQVTLTTVGGTSATHAGTRFTYTKKPVLTTIAKFAGGQNDGSFPRGGLVADLAGALYGTTSGGGNNDSGVVFKLTPSGNTFTKTILHHFDETTGVTPFAGLVIDNQKNLYGVTTSGGANGQGVIFKYTAATQKLTVLYSFKGNATDGGVPHATLARDAAGLLYGATTVGGQKGKGTTFTFKEPGTFKVTHHFAGGADGNGPRGAMLLDANKNVYGTTYLGGGPNNGIAYKIAPNGARTILHTFKANNDGERPLGGLFAVGSMLFGTTSEGGTADRGTVFEIMPPSTAAPILFKFTGANGANPNAGVVGDAATILYGTTNGGGEQNKGTVFKLLPPANNQTAWSQSVMVSFKGGANEGSSPRAPVLLGKNRTLYGTTYSGGSAACNCGTVFKVEY